MYNYIQDAKRIRMQNFLAFQNLSNGIKNV